MIRDERPLADKLRQLAGFYSISYPYCNKLLLEAADEIDRLNTEAEELIDEIDKLNARMGFG